MYWRACTTRDVEEGATSTTGGVIACTTNYVLCYQQHRVLTAEHTNTTTYYLLRGRGYSYHQGWEYIYCKHVCTARGYYVEDVREEETACSGLRSIARKPQVLLDEDTGIYYYLLSGDVST